MGFVIGAECIDVMDNSCVEVCPVDCIYEGDRKRYIHPDECIDCGACEAACPVEAIAPQRRLRPSNQVHKDDNRAFFETVLPTRESPVGSPGGAEKVGRIGVDTPLVASLAAGAARRDQGTTVRSVPGQMVQGGSGPADHGAPPGAVEERQ